MKRAQYLSLLVTALAWVGIGVVLRAAATDRWWFNSKWGPIGLIALATLATAYLFLLLATRRQPASPLEWWISSVAIWMAAVALPATLVSSIS